MIGPRTLWLASGFAAGLLLTGLPYWRLPYNANFFADTALLLGFGGLAVVTAAVAVAGKVPLGRLFWVMLAAFPAAVAVRVAFEVAKDATDHNLWPFELIIAVIVSLVAIVPGLIVGALLRRLKA